MRIWIVALIVLLAFGAQAQNTSDKYIRHTNGEIERFVTRENGQTIYLRHAESGALMVSGFYTGSERDGVWQRFDAEGNKLEEIQYQNGCKNGTQTVYNAQGNLLYEVHYSNGVIDRAIEFANDGSVVAVR